MTYLVFLLWIKSAISSSHSWRTYISDTLYLSLVHTEVFFFLKFLFSYPRGYRAPTFYLVPRMRTISLKELRLELRPIWYIGGSDNLCTHLDEKQEPPLWFWMLGLCMINGPEGASCAKIPGIPESWVHLEIPFQRFQIFPVLNGNFKRRKITICSLLIKKVCQCLTPPEIRGGKHQNAKLVAWMVHWLALYLLLGSSRQAIAGPLAPRVNMASGHS